MSKLQTQTVSLRASYENRRPNKALPPAPQTNSLRYSKTTTLGSLLRTLFELRHRSSGACFGNLDSYLLRQHTAHASLECLRFARSIMVGKKKHPVPGGLQLVGQVRNHGNVVGHSDVFATSARENRKITRGCQIRAEQSPPTDLQFDTQ